MSFSLSLFWLFLRQRLGRVRSWLTLLLPVLLVWGILSMAQTPASTPVTVGVCLPESGGEALWALLEEQNSDLLTFVKADADTIDRNVASGQWDCGLLIREDFAQCLEELDLDKVITLRISGASTVYPLVQESVASCIARLAAPYIAREYLLESGIAGSEDLPSLLFRLEQIDARSSHVDVVLTSLDGIALTVPELTRQGIRLVLCWLVCAMILVRMLFGTVDLGNWSCAAAVRRMYPLRSPFCLLLTKAAADALLTALSGCLAIAALGLGLWGCLAVACYTLFLLSLSVLLAQFPKISGILPVCVPFLVLISLLLSSVLADLSVFLPGFRVISRLLPVSRFLMLCGGDPAGAALLLPTALLLPAAALVRSSEER